MRTQHKRINVLWSHEKHHIATYWAPFTNSSQRSSSEKTSCNSILNAHPTCTRIVIVMTVSILWHVQYTSVLMFVSTMISKSVDKFDLRFHWQRLFWISSEIPRWRFCCHGSCYFCWHVQWHLCLHIEAIARLSETEQPHIIIDETHAYRRGASNSSKAHPLFSVGISLHRAFTEEAEDIDHVFPRRPVRIEKQWSQSNDDSDGKHAMTHMNYWFTSGGVDISKHAVLHACHCQLGTLHNSENGYVTACCLHVGSCYESSCSHVLLEVVSFLPGGIMCA